MLFFYAVGEKFRDWTDEEPSLDVVLETVTMWWLLGSFPKAIYAYSEVRPLSLSPCLPPFSFLFLALLHAVTSETILTNSPFQLTSGVGAWHRDPALFLTKPFGFSSLDRKSVV